MSWTVGEAIPAGTVIVFDDLQEAEGAATVTAAGVANPGVLAGNTSMGLATSNEDIYAYQGADITTPSTFISHITTDPTASNTGDIPPGMTAANGYVGLTNDDDVAVYSGSLTFATPAEALAAIGNPANWTSQGGLSVDESEDGVAPDFPDDVPATIAVCFAEGTVIATRDGDCAVQDLAIGDPVMTQDGISVPVKWIGRQTISNLFGPAERLMPVRVWVGALGDGLPVRDLTLTADHALLVDGLLVNAGALVNGSSIDHVPLSELGDSYTVYHIETENHDVILAEGIPAETYIDYAARRAFDNYAEYQALYGEDRMIREMPCPRISTARMLPPALRMRFQTDRVA